MNSQANSACPSIISKLRNLTTLDEILSEIVETRLESRSDGDGHFIGEIVSKIAETRLESRSHGGHFIALVKLTKKIKRGRTLARDSAGGVITIFNPFCSCARSRMVSVRRKGPITKNKNAQVAVVSEAIDRVRGRAPSPRQAR